MKEMIVNRPIAETFGWLHMGGTRIMAPERERAITCALAEGETRTVVVEDTEEAALVTADLAQGACLHLIGIRRAGAAGLARTDIRVRCGEGAAFHWYRLILGGQESYDNCSVTLEGTASSFTADIGYRLGGQEKYDINCEAIHTGRSTESRITASGVLSESARKLMRGTIDFRSGCSGSVGQETEDVLLMDETVRNQSVPVILCAEEDVAGDHGATIGRPDEKSLYYMGSRGLDTETACAMLAQAKLDAVIGRIPDPALRDALREETTR